MRFFVWTDGGHQIFSDFDGDCPFPATEVPRLPEAFEKWDFDAKQFVFSEGDKIRAASTPQHVAAMHLRKADQAHMILNGVIDPEMLLVREAVLRGIDPVDLAKMVREKASEAEELELKRQEFSMKGNES